MIIISSFLINLKFLFNVLKFILIFYQNKMIIIRNAIPIK